MLSGINKTGHELFNKPGSARRASDRKPAGARLRRALIAASTVPHIYVLTKNIYNI